MGIDVMLWKKLDLTCIWALVYAVLLVPTPVFLSTEKAAQVAQGKYDNMQAQWYNCLSGQPMTGYVEDMAIEFECKEVQHATGTLRMQHRLSKRNR